MSSHLLSNSKGPIIGILTSRKKNGHIAGNFPLFIELQKKLISLDGISFIFTLDGVDEDYIHGFTFIPEKNVWEKIIAPFPDLVYNRVPFRKAEKDVECQQFFTQLKGKNIPFFNPCFIDKFELYILLKEHKFLHQYLPDTIRIFQSEQLWFFLTKHKNIYLKPAQSAKGKGIFKVELDEKMTIKIEGLSMNQMYPSFLSFWKKWETEFYEKNYLAQEEIKSSQYNGNRFDFRILAHAENDDYLVTGVGIRQSQAQEITTHIPSGGKLLPYQLIQTEEHDRFIKLCVHHVGKALSEHFGFFGEFSIDAGISQTGHYYIYEVNSKPMSFDENEIEERKISQLCTLFLQLAYEN